MMKVAFCVILTIVIWCGNDASAQDVHDTSAPQQSSADVKKQEDESESDEERFDYSIAETVDNDLNEKPSSESAQTENDIDVEIFPADFEREVAAHDSAVEFDDYDDLESEGKDSSPASQQPMTEFPPPFDHSTVDLADVAQVAHFVLLIDT